MYKSYTCVHIFYMLDTFTEISGSHFRGKFGGSISVGQCCACDTDRVKSAVTKRQSECLPACSWNCPTDVPSSSWK